MDRIRGGILGGKVVNIVYSSGVVFPLFKIGPMVHGTF